MLNAGTDISDLKQSDLSNLVGTNYFRLLFENAPAGIALVSENGRFQIVNPSLCTLLGYQRDELITKSIDEVTHPQDILIGSERIEKLISEKVPFVQIDKRFIHKQGYIVQAILQISLLHVENHPQFIMELTDITQFKEANEDVFFKQKMESMGKMAGGIAHQYNNLLVGILGQATVALAKLDEGHPAIKHIEKAVTSAKQAAYLTQQMLAYSGSRFLEKEPLNLNEVICESLPLIQAAIPRQIQIHSQLASNIPFVMGDKGQLQQVLMNLTLNSMEAIKNSGRIVISTDVLLLKSPDSLQKNDLGYQLTPGYYVQLAVHDDGCGMSDVTKRNVFDPFFTTKFTGRGLGLAAVKGIVEGHGGGIQIFSEVDVGTTFHLYFPIINNDFEETAVSAPQTCEA